MYSSKEASHMRTEFWVVFGQYLKPVPNCQGFKTKWANYKTGVKNIYFRMKTEYNFASIGIEISHGDEELQELYFDQFLQFKTILTQTIGEEWDWKLHTKNEIGQKISKIEKILPQVNVMNSGDWSTIISFLKPRIIALDEFWDQEKPGFEDL